MINLLPPQEKQILLKEKQFQEILTLSAIILVAFSFLSLMLFLIKIDLSGRLSLHQEIWQQKNKEFEISEIKNLEQEIGFLNQILPKLDSFYQDKFYLINVLEDLAQTLSSELYLTNFSYRNEEKEVSVSGFSPSRTVLLEFKKALEVKENFKEIYFPSSNWINPADIDFTVTFKIK